MSKKLRLMKTETVIQNFIIICLLLLIFLTISSSFYIMWGNKMKPEAYTKVEYEYVDVPEYDIREATEQVKKLFNVPHIYIEREIYDFVYGKAIPLLHIVMIQDNLRLYHKDTYIYTYAHELAHVKYATSNETFTEYKSIVVLYESGIDYLQAIAWNEAVNIMRGCYRGNKYDCGKQLIDYFKTTAKLVER